MEQPMEPHIQNIQWLLRCGETFLPSNVDLQTSHHRGP